MNTNVKPKGAFSRSSNAQSNSLLRPLKANALVDLELLGDVGLGDAESRGVLNESALVSGRHIFGGHFPLRIALLRDARATNGKLSAALSVRVSLGRSPRPFVAISREREPTS